MNYYERHIGDYLKNTAHLSLLEHGIYTRLMDVYYTREDGIPVDQVERLIGVRSKDERNALGNVLDEFFTAVDEVLRQDRCDKEISRYKDKQRKAKASADARWSHTDRNAKAMRTHSEGNALQSPVTSNHKNTKAPPPPDGVDETVWQDFLKLRKAKKAPVTDTAIDGIRREADKAGMTLADALAMCCKRGWQGFDADWVKDKSGPNQFAGAI